ncbi:MAG: SIMPL domain-containing protein [Woeseiaceae bacterium]|nr:SIMPL domain-containing protein [Woeseiaceae bacterium]
MQTISERPFIYCVVLSWLLAGAAGAVAADAKSAITVLGSGEVLAKPDMARVNVGVVTQHATAGESVRQNTAAVEAVFEALRRHNIADDDMQTSNFSIAPEYNYDRPAQSQRLIGYRVTNEVRVTVRDIDALGAILDAVVSAGSNQVNQVLFDIDDTQPLEDEARRAAMQDAARKARLYADEAGVQLGAVTGVEEIAGPVAMPQVFGAVMAQEARAVPIAPGQQVVRHTVRVSFAIE